MKQLLLIVLVGVAFPAMSSSTAHGGALEAGVKIGINGAGIYGEGTDEWGGKSGICLGGLVAYKVNRFFGVQGELMYSQKGARIENTSRDEPTTLKVDYIEIPIFAKLSNISGGMMCCIPLPEGRRTSLYLGPALGLKIASSIETETGGSSDADVDAKTLDIGLALGVSFGYGSENLSVFADFRFTAGLMPVYGESVVSDARNYAAYMGLGMAFGL
jgi:hypothetical protein